MRSEGLREQEWVLLDYGDEVVRVLFEEIRGFYEIESLYGDVDTLEWSSAGSSD